jgi:hypothetical protein
MDVFPIKRPGVNKMGKIKIQLYVTSQKLTPLLRICMD